MRPHGRSGYTRADGTHVSPASVTGHCQRNPPSFQKWNDKIRNGLPPHWALKNEESKDWTEDEKERVLEALSELPKTLIADFIDGIYRLKTSDIYSLNPGSQREHEIALYDEAFGENQKMARVLGHEFAHELYSQFSDDEKDSYNKTADWITRDLRSGGKIFIPVRDGYVEDDGQESPGEDFANNIEYYLFNPEKLQILSPKVYEWIHTHYGDNFKLGKG